MIWRHVGNFMTKNYILQRNQNKSIKANFWHIIFILFSWRCIMIGFFTLHSICRKNTNTSTKFMCSDFWWFLMNVISKYLFLEQFCQFSERVLKFLSKAGDSIHSFSSCTHIGALKTEWKCIFSWKSAYLYTSTVHILRQQL